MRFTVRRLPSGEVSPCGHRPSGGDVACSVDVGVAPSSRAGLALEDRLALAVIGSEVPAHRASLRRVRGRNLLDPTVSLVLQARGEQPPTAAADGPVEATLLGDAHPGLRDGSPRAAGHCAHVKDFDSYRVEPACNVGGGLLDPVLPPIGLTRLQSLCLAPTQARGVQEFTCRQRRRHGNATVNTDHAAVTRTGDGVRDVRERDMPAASPITGHPVRLDARRRGPRQPEPHPAHLEHPHPAEPAVQPLHLVWFHPDLPEPLVHTGFAPCGTTVRAREEVTHGLREIPQCLLLHRLTTGPQPSVLRASLCQLRAPLHIAGRLKPRSPIPLLLHRQIPHIPRVPAMRQQRVLLLRPGQQPKPRHTRTLAIDTDMPHVACRLHAADGPTVR
jgi:hypothetical protein